MPAFTATAPGKIILFGEHAVVYGMPAVAVPVKQVYARAVFSAAPGAPSEQVWIQAPDIGLDAALDQLPDSHPIVIALRSVQAALVVERLPACRLRVTSTIPLAAGLGSGAAISVAIIRAFSAFLGRPLAVEQVSKLTFEVEKVFHGTPSGIDNTVVSYEKPVYFVRGRPIKLLHVAAPFTIVIGDTGISSPTSVAVGDVRRGWLAAPERYDAYFKQIGQIADKAKDLILNGNPPALGLLMDQNHALLQKIGVSSPELDHLVAAARSAGAIGAKLSGAGCGGNMIALAAPHTAALIADSLAAHGAVRTLITQVDSLSLEGTNGNTAGD